VLRRVLGDSIERILVSTYPTMSGAGAEPRYNYPHGRRPTIFVLCLEALLVCPEMRIGISWSARGKV
jgi:hypothetical protein